MGFLSSIGKAIGGIASSITGGDLLGFGGSLLGGVMQNEGSAKQASMANAASKEAMQNRHQWEVNDLRAAGLNPILSANSAPSILPGQQAQVSDVLGPAVSTAMASRRLRAEIANMEATNEKIKSDVDLNRDLQVQARAGAGLAASNARAVQLDTARREAVNPLWKLATDVGEWSANQLRSNYTQIQNIVARSNARSKSGYRDGKPYIVVNPDFK